LVSEIETATMKHETKTRRQNSWKIVMLLGFVGIAAVSGNAAWMAAGFSGLVAVSIFARNSEPELAPVRVRSQEVRSQKKHW
jgi:hypothetical protein